MGWGSIGHIGQFGHIGPGAAGRRSSESYWEKCCSDPMCMMHALWCLVAMEFFVGLEILYPKMVSSPWTVVRFWCCTLAELLHRGSVREGSVLESGAYGGF